MCIYACAVLLIGGRAGPIFDSWSLTSLLRVGHRVATQHAGVDTRPAVQFLAPPRYAELSRLASANLHIGSFACFHAISVVSAKSPHYFSCPCSTEAVGIAHKPPRSL